MFFSIIQNEPYEEGCFAFSDNIPLSKSNYVPFSDGEYEWLRGWRDSHSKQLSENFVNDEPEEITYESDDEFYVHHGWIMESERKGKYQGNTVTLDKPTRGDVKRFKVYVDSGKKDADGNVIAKKVNFGSEKGSKLRVRKNDPDARKSFAARHKCDTAKDKTTARYWSCRGATSTSDAKYW